MAHHLDLGKLGEVMARDYLLQQGFKILDQNWRYGHMEVDVVASKNDILHFIEVKTRRNHEFGYPEESVDDKKMENLIDVAEAYQTKYPEWENIQFDILSISMEKGKPNAFFFIEDVYL